MNIVFTPSFQRSYKKFTKGNESLQEKINNTLRLLASDPASQELKTHKLSGKLQGLFACSCGYDCRIIFLIEENKSTKEKTVILVDIGTHDEVY
ncbi:MAG: type II toxin-antitoxin system mRNA interferase toxin, RelE/StbE family [Bacteroidota bacterium]